MDDLAARLATDLDDTFESFVRSHQDRVFSIALRLAGHRQDAEEIAQDAFVRAYHALRRYDAERIRALELRPWLATIVINLCRNRARARRPVHVPIDGSDGTPVGLPDDPSASPPAAAERREAAGHWAGLLAALPETYRVVVVLRHVDGLSYPEMAQALARPEGTIKAQVHRGLSLLRAAHDAAERGETASGPATRDRTNWLLEVHR